MKVSIVTGTFNSEKYISDCVSSIYKQGHENIEHIIIDGASQDNTIEIIKNIPNRVSKIISEKDEGIYDAMNKGLALTTGDIVGILNSDDFYNSDTILEKVVAKFEDESVDCVFGDLFYVNQENTDLIRRKWVTGPFKKDSFRKGWHPAHPTFFVRKSVYEKYGAFDLDLNLAADFELMLRFLEKHKLKSSYINEPMVRMRLGGATSKNVGNILKQNKECMLAFKKNEVAVSPFYPIFRLLPKLKQFL